MQNKMPFFSNVVLVADELPVFAGKKSQVTEAVFKEFCVCECDWVWGTGAGSLSLTYH